VECIDFKPLCRNTLRCFAVIRVEQMRPIAHEYRCRIASERLALTEQQADAYNLARITKPDWRLNNGVREAIETEELRLTKFVRRTSSPPAAYCPACPCIERHSPWQSVTKCFPPGICKPPIWAASRSTWSSKRLRWKR